MDKGAGGLRRGLSRQTAAARRDFAALEKSFGARVEVTDIRRRGNSFFYRRRGTDEQDFKLYVREGWTGAERLSVDPNKFVSDGKRYRSAASPFGCASIMIRGTASARSGNHSTRSSPSCLLFYFNS